MGLIAVSWTAIKLALGLWFLYKLFSFAKFYTHARRAGFPIYLSPILSKSIPWMIIGPTFEPQFRRYLPTWAFERLELTIHGWEFRVKRKWHDRLGNIFCIVSPDECTLVYVPYIELYNR